METIQQPTSSNTPNQQPVPLQTHEDLEGKATTSLILGIIGMIAWILPLAGFPVNIIGIVKAAKGLRSTKSGTAVAGLVLSIIGLILTTINAGIGAYMGATGQYDLFNQ